MTYRSSHSSIERFNRCPRLHYLQKIKGIRAAQLGRPLLFGTAFGAALAEYHVSGDAQQVLLVWQQETIKAGLDIEDSIFGRALLLGYMSKWPSLMVDPTEIEKEVTYRPIGPDGEPDETMEFFGFCDVGSPLMDHKTTSRNLCATTIEKMVANPQAEEYILATGAEEAIWDMVHVRRPKRRMKTPEAEQEFYLRDCKYGKKGEPKKGTFLEDESLDEYFARISEEITSDPERWFQRRKIRPIEAELDRRRYDIWATMRLMQLAEEHEVYPRNPSSCGDFGGCDMKPICWEGVDPEHSELYKIRKD